MEGGVLVHPADADQAEFGGQGEVEEALDGLEAEELVAVVLGRHDDRQRHREMRRLGQVGEPGEHVVEARRALHGDVADQRDQLVLVADHARHALDGGAERPAGADRDDDRLGLAEPLFEEHGGALGDAEDRAVGGRIGGHRKGRGQSAR